MKRVFFILITLLLLAAGCKDDNEAEEASPEYLQAFLGQWQEIACGNDTYPELTPDGHILDFLTDGTGLYSSCDRTVTSERTCRADAGFLYFGSGTEPDGHTYRYTFTGTDTLRLDYVAGAMTKSMGTPHFHIYKRVNINDPLECGAKSENDDPLGPRMEPAERILGKWQEVARGNDVYPGFPPGPVLTPSDSVVEFLPDGTYRGPYGLHHYNRRDKEPALYRMASDSLYLYREADTDDSFYIYRYLFTGNDQLAAVYLHGGIEKSMNVPKFHIYERFPLPEGGDKDGDGDENMELLPPLPERILGKWQEVARGCEAYPELPPEYGASHTIEFLPDGTYRGPYGFHYGNIDDEATLYRLESDSLYLYREERSPYIYRYIFTGADRFLAQYIYGDMLWVFPTASFHIFERIK